ncbi:MAG: hypothetical protein H0W84_03215 [Bacteroidetes bacterium]|nr:hypothetical protein [Bacteroidota bacterium]
MKTVLKTVKDNFKATNKTLFIFSVLLFLYTTIRAFLLSITWDEAYSYLEFVRTGNLYSRDFNSMSANNHLLYTFLEIPFANLFGASEFVLRLPSLIAHIMFLFYSAKLVKHFNDKWLVLASFLVINLNPYLLDFFSLARGYGLSLGLMMASLYYLYLFQNIGKNKFSMLSLLLGALGVLANYVLLNYYLALFGMVMILLLYNSIKSGNTATQKRMFFLKDSVIPIVILSLLLLLILPITFKLKEAGALFFWWK